METALIKASDTHDASDVDETSEADEASDVRNTITTSIAVCAVESRDAARVVEILKDCGPDFSNVFYCDYSHLADIEAYAALIFHRTRHQISDIVFPDAMRVSRTLVLSDCTDVDTAVKYLKSGARHVFNINETNALLVARIQAALRRHQDVAFSPFSVGDIDFDVANRTVRRAGRVIDLSPKEFDFAVHVFSRQDKIVRVTELMTSVWSLPPHMDTRRIDTAACRVRKKLRLTAEHGWELIRVRRVGYRLIATQPMQNELSA